MAFSSAFQRSVERGVFGIGQNIWAKRAQIRNLFVRVACADFKNGCREQNRRRLWPHNTRPLLSITHSGRFAFDKFPASPHQQMGIKKEVVSRNLLLSAFLVGVRDRIFGRPAAVFAQRKDLFPGFRVFRLLLSLWPRVSRPIRLFQFPHRSVTIGNGICHDTLLRFLSALHYSSPFSSHRIDYRRGQEVDAGRQYRFPKSSAGQK